MANDPLFIIIIITLTSESAGGQRIQGKRPRMLLQSAANRPACAPCGGADLVSPARAKGGVEETLRGVESIINHPDVSRAAAMSSNRGISIVQLLSAVCSGLVARCAIRK